MLGTLQTQVILFLKRKHRSDKNKDLLQVYQAQFYPNGARGYGV
jgi:hypothetical protein